jgi:23S rRNA C2498 (ribose-2'-O)-methylase RlmM
MMPYGDPRRLVENVGHWRERSEEARAIAGQIDKAIYASEECQELAERAQQLLRSIAFDYLMIARTAEAIAQSLKKIEATRARLEAQGLGDAVA